MKPFFVRPVRPGDTEKFIKYSDETPDNLWEPDVITYPSTFTRCVFNSNGPILFAPIQKPLFIDSLAFSPDSSEIDRAVAMKELVQDTVSQAYIQGAGEVLFLCKEESTINFAKKHLFEELPYRLFRIRLKDLEKKSEPENENKIPKV